MAGRVDSGSLRVGDEVVFYPSGKKSHVRSFEAFSRAPHDTAAVAESIGFTLSEQIYVTRGEPAVRRRNTS